MAKKASNSNDSGSMKMTAEQFIAAIVARGNADPFGIATAAAHMKSLLPCFDAETGGLCPKNVFELSTPDRWAKALDEAAGKLTYCAADMLVSTKDVITSGLKTKNALCEFDHILTSTRQDLDGDILESEGANTQHCKALLWQHIPLQPIGVFMGETARTKDFVAGRSAIVDTALGRDAMVLTEAGALRISHGFKPYEYEPLEQKSGGRWRVKKFDIFEDSLVSVPSNLDAVITSFSRGKLHHPLVKSWAGLINEHRTKVVNVGLDLQTKDAVTSTTPTGSSMGGELPADKKVKCPLCGQSKIDSTGTCEACGHVTGKAAQDDLSNKAGRVLSAANEAKVKKIAELASELLAAIASDTDTGTEPVKAAAGLVTKSAQLGAKGFYGDSELAGSYESIQRTLYRTAKNYLLGKGHSVSSDSWADIVATYDGKAIVCVHNYGTNDYPCFEIGWKLSAGGTPSWDGDPKAVKIQTSVVEKAFAESATKSAKLGMQPVAQQQEMSVSDLAKALNRKAHASGSREALAVLESVAKSAEFLRDTIERCEVDELVPA